MIVASPGLTIGTMSIVILGVVKLMEQFTGRAYRDRLVRHAKRFLGVVVVMGVMLYVPSSVFFLAEAVREQFSWEAEVAQDANVSS